VSVNLLPSSERLLGMPPDPRQKHFNPLTSQPAGWPADGKFFPLGRNSAVKADWTKVWDYILIAKEFMSKVHRKCDPQVPRMEAVEVVDDVLNNMETFVLTTIFVRGWSLGWARNLIGFILNNVSTASYVRLIAVQGGPVCEEEVAFTKILLLELGFSIVFENSGSPEVAERYTLRCKLDGVQVTTPAMPFEVLVKQYHSVNQIYRNLQQDVSPNWSFSRVPNLQRLAVISCAEMWFIDGHSKRLNPEEVDEHHPDGMTVNDKLNSEIMRALEDAKTRAASKGFRPNENWKKSEEANKVYHEYFDLSLRTLASMGITPTG